MLSLICILAVLPSTTLAYTTVRPTSVTKTSGRLISGTLSSFYYADGSEYKVHGSGWWVYLINFYTDYPNNNPSGDDPYVDMKLYFYGGGTVKVTVSYYGGTSDVFTFSSGTQIWFWKPFDSGKTISRIRWENTEWWNPGRVYVDIAVVYYD